MKTKRIYLIDTIRGITILSMVAFHFTWDLANLFGKDLPFLYTNGAYYWQQSICWSFILLSGFCWSFGKHPWRRGLLVFLIGAAITFVTVFFMPDERIVYGILTFMGSAMLITTALHPLLKKLPSLPSCLLTFFVFLFTKKIARGYFGFSFLEITLSSKLYCNLFSTYLGFPYKGFFSTDYFAVFPWIFLFFTGYFINKWFVEENLWHYIPEIREPVFSFLGRHSLFIYVIHQPLLYGIYLLWTSFR